MNPLLLRQLRKHAPDLDLNQPTSGALCNAISDAYDELQQEHAFLEHTLEVVSRELTEVNERLRQESEKRLASINDYYQGVLSHQEGMTICVKRTERGFVHTLCRGELARRLGLFSHRVEGCTVEEIAAPENVAELNQAYAQAWSGRHTTLTYRSARTGTVVYASMRPHLENDVITEVISSSVDITSLMAAEADLRLAKDRAEAADRAKSEFLAVMSHEIRTPLNAVLGFATMLRDSPLSQEQIHWTRTIGTAGESLLALIDDILDFSKIEAGQLELRPEPVSITLLLDAMTSMFHARCAAKGLSLETTQAPDLPDWIEIDAQRLRQILINLIGNAVKFTQQGTIKVSVELAAPAASLDGTCLLRFTVRDTGIGIPRERRDRLFKPFSQVDSSITRHYGGTGLGLAISERLSRLLGGGIGVESQPGNGSTFFFTVRATPRGAPAARAPVESEAPPPSPSGLRILVAEDQPENRMLLEDYLSDRGFTADVVENGRFAIEAVKERPYDLILLDIQMPEVDGYTAARAIRQHYGAARGPRIFALTANVFAEDRARCREAGMDGLLAKPIDFDDLKRVLANQAPKNPY